MSLQILNPKFAEGGLEKYSHMIMGAILLLALLMASLAFVNVNGGYQLVGAFCALPIRPFWYRLTLGWIERYCIAIVIVGLTVAIRIRVKTYQQTLARLQCAELCQRPTELEEMIKEESDEEDSPSLRTDEKQDDRSNEKVNEQLEEKNDLVKEQTIPDDEHNQFSAEDLRFQRLSYSRRPLPAIGHLDFQNRNASVTFSAAPSSAIFSPYRVSRAQMSDLDDLSVTDAPTRRQSMVAASTASQRLSVMDMPARRASYIDTVPRSVSQHGPGSRHSAFNNPKLDRSAMLPPPSRRSSIWDEIDASLEKKYASPRMSVLSTTTLQIDTTHVKDEPPNSTRPGSRRYSATAIITSDNTSKRRSRVVDVAMRTLSLISKAPDSEEPADSLAAIMQRRQRYIERQLRYLLLYPFVYLGLWLCPFVLHCLQYSDRFANRPPFALVILSFMSMTLFGFSNSLVFCLREKPWTLIDHSDGTIGGSVKHCRLWAAVGRRRVKAHSALGADGPA